MANEAAGRAPGDHAQQHGQRHDVAADGFEAADQRGQADGAKQETQPVQTRRALFLDLGHVAQHQRDAQDADRDVDQENPVPRHVGDHEAAQRRPDHRAQ
ncbi:hypothetical protein G6F63_015862 [Rhizopus arrhizus]|nr:hypothetical protein G6F63_015862 [Rhizopus arrhizus]